MRARFHFDEDLGTLSAELQHLGHLATRAVNEAFSALREHDSERARQVIANDQRINEAERDIETHALRLIATQQPVATDMRRLVVTIEIAGELERIADYAKGIARAVIRDAASLPETIPAEMVQMAQMATTMLTTALEAFVTHDVARAEAIGPVDDDVDALYEQVEKTLLRQMTHDPAASAWVPGALFSAYYLERVADRATNIAERVVYLVNARLVDFNP